MIKQLPKTQQKKIVSLIQEQEEFEVPEWHKKIVLDRMKKEKLSEGIPWKEARKKLKFKTKLGLSEKFDDELNDDFLLGAKKDKSGLALKFELM